MRIPPLFGVTQAFDSSRLEDVGGAVRRGFAELPAETVRRIRPGMSVALLVGSRGIADLPEIVKTTIECLRERGLSVYITPCMGSHGGGTSAGQVELLDGLGISEATMGVPICANMDVTTLGSLPGGPGVYFCTDALKADFIVPIVRIKMHTRLVGPIGSGFCKMLCIGAGKISGAQEYHRHGVEGPLLPAAQMILASVDKFLCGVGVVENAHDRIHTLRVVLPQDFVETDKACLTLSRSLFPTIPLARADMLVVNEIGKDISGAGADVNVIGKWRRDGGKRTPDFDIQAVLDITPVSHGNAMGMGNFDLATRHFEQQIDRSITYTNAISSTRFRAVRLPLIVENDRALFETVLQTRAEPEKLSIALIRNTADLARIWVTEHLVAELAGSVPVHVDAAPQELAFDETGRLIMPQ